jgi:putative transposase
MRYGKPYPRDYWRPEDAEERLRRKVGKALKGEERALPGFLDECRPQTDSNTSRVWSLRRPRTRKNTSIYRANTFGFYSPGGRSVIGFKENSRKESVCMFLEEVRASNPGGRVLVVLDNFPSHRARRTRERAEELGMCLVYLPPYSPDLNPIEQIWRGLKRRISTAFFRTRKEFLELIENAYHNLSNKVSYARGWILKFMPAQFNQLCP